MADGPDIKAILKPERIVVLEETTKRRALEVLIDSLADCPDVRDRDELARGIFYREELMSTGIGMGIGVPHVRLASVERPVMCVGICRRPLADYVSLDNQPVRLIFMIAAGKDQQAEYLRLLSRLSGKVKQPAVRDALLTTADPDGAYRILVENGA